MPPWTSRRAGGCGCPGFRAETSIGLGVLGTRDDHLCGGKNTVGDAVLAKEGNHLSLLDVRNEGIDEDALQAPADLQPDFVLLGVDHEQQAVAMATFAANAVVVEIPDGKPADVTASGSGHHSIVDAVILQQECMMVADPGQLIRCEEPETIVDERRLNALRMAQDHPSAD